MRPTRRKLFQLAAVLPLARVAPALAQGHPDAELLRELLALEQDANLIYGTLRGGPELSSRLFREQSREHVRGLEIALRNRGRRPPQPRARAGLATPEQALRLESRAVAVYHRTIGELSDDRLLPALTGIMANHGQRQVVLRRALGRDPLPDAFPTR